MPSSSSSNTSQGSLCMVHSVWWGPHLPTHSTALCFLRMGGGGHRAGVQQTPVTLGSPWASKGECPLPLTLATLHPGRPLPLRMWGRCHCPSFPLLKNSVSFQLTVLCPVVLSGGPGNFLFISDTLKFSYGLTGRGSFSFIILWVWANLFSLRVSAALKFLHVVFNWQFSCHCVFGLPFWNCYELCIGSIM